MYKIKFITGFLFLVFLSSCAGTKKNISVSDKNEKKQQSYIYYFDEANKSRNNGNFDLALEQYYSALDINPKSAAALFYMADIYSNQKDFQTALSFSEKAFKLQPNNFWYNYQNSALLYASGQKKKAIAEYHKLIDKYPYKELIYNRLKDIYTENKDTKNLIILLEKKQKNFGLDSEIALDLFNLYLHEKNYAKAEKIINQLIADYPEDYSFKGMAAEFYYNTNKKEKAEKIYSELMADFPENTDVVLSYALYCKRQNKKERFFEITKKLFNSDLKFIKKTYLLNSGQYKNFPDKEYLVLLNILYKKHPNEMLSNTFFAEYYIEKNKKKDALPYLRKVLKLNPSDFTMALLLFNLEYDIKNFTALYEDTKTCETYFPNRPQLFLFKGISEYNLNKFSNAEQSLKTGKNLIIDDTKLENRFIYYLSLLNFNQKNFEKALSFAKKIENSEQYAKKIFELLGDLYFAKQNKEKALLYWNKAKNKGNNSDKLMFKINNFDKLKIDDIIEKRN